MSQNYLSSIYPPMISKLSIHKAVNHLMRLLSKENSQWEYYDWQKASIMELRVYPWYQYIIDYRNIEAENAMTSLSDIKTPKELIPYYQAKHNTAINFLDWLNNVAE